MPTVGYEVKGLEEAIRQLSPEKVAKPVRDFLTKAIITVQGLARERAAVDTGRMRQAVAYEVDSSSPPTWAKVGVNVNRAGFDYPAALDESERYHYAAGPFAGEQTKGWLSDTPKEAGSEIDGFLGQLEDELKESLGG
jgi:hypothetical protein